MAYSIQNTATKLYLTEGGEWKKHPTQIFLTRKDAANVKRLLKGEDRLQSFIAKIKGPNRGTVFFHGNCINLPCIVLNTTNENIIRLDTNGSVVTWGSIVDWYQELASRDITVVYEPHMA